MALALPTLTDVTPVDVAVLAEERGGGGRRRAAPQYGWHPGTERAARVGVHRRMKIHCAGRSVG